MIRIRDAAGRPLEGVFKFVEICDQDGNPALVFFQDDRGAIRQLEKGHPDADRYEKITGSKFVPVVRR